MTDIAVVGGGMAGLLIGLALEMAGVDDYLVLEAGDSPGGVARTQRHGGIALEPGAGSFPLPHPALSPLLEHAGVQVEESAATARYVYVDKRLVEVAGPRQALSLLPLGAKLRVLMEPLVRSNGQGEETLAAFLKRRLGDRAGGLASSLMAAGVFAGDPSALSVNSAFPLLAGVEQTHGSLLRGAIASRKGRAGARPRSHIPVGGMDTLADGIAATLGSHFRSGFPVSSLRKDGDQWVLTGPDELRAARVVMATPAVETGRMIGGEAGALLSQAVTAPVLVAGFSSPQALPAGFGILVPPGGHRMASIGILLESSYAPERGGGSSLVKVIAGGAIRPEVAGWDPAQAAVALGAEVAEVLGWDTTPRLEVSCIRSIPQYPPGHGVWLAEIESRLAPGISLAGWSFRGPGITQLASDARRLATALTK